MLLNVNVKNLALIKEQDVYFKDGMNILTGETGAGKSIIIGSINIALGGKVSKDMIRDESKTAMVEIVFQINNEDTLNKLAEKGIEPEDGQIAISRKFVNGRSITKVNGETMSLQNLRGITALLIDIHGQHDHQSLLQVEKHMEILDEFAKTELLKVKQTVGDNYKKYVAAKKNLSRFDMDEEQRVRKKEFLRYEIDEIQDANLKAGEDVQLEEAFRKTANIQKILEGLSAVQNTIDGDMDNSVINQVSFAVREMSQVAGYDDGVAGMYDQLLNIESLCSDLSRDIKEYVDDCMFDPETAKEMEERLSTINHLKLKYGNSIEKILEYLDERQAEYSELDDYEAARESALKELEQCKIKLEKACDELTKQRKKASAVFENKVVSTLADLNFLEVRFEVLFSKSEHFTEQGNDEIEFMISTNPGEPLRPLAKIASGGEVSRIMLGIKTIMAGKDKIDTLIFDEIDTGISGRTAQKVAEQMKGLSREHQIICITHLPQIAAMADCHLKIEKSVNNNETTTDIFELDEEASVNELARMLGGAEITDTVLQNAREMKNLAVKTK